MFVVVQLLSRVWLFVTPWTAAFQASLSFTISPSLLKLMSIEFAQTHIHQVCNVIQPSHPLFLPPSLSALNLSQHQGLFQWVSSSHQVAKGLELQLQHQSLLPLQGTWVPSLLGELRFHMPCSAINKKRERQISKVISRGRYPVLPAAARGVACGEPEKDLQDSVTHHPSLLPVLFLQGSF